MPLALPLIFVTRNYYTTNAKQANTNKRDVSFCLQQGRGAQYVAGDGGGRVSRGHWRSNQDV